MDRVLPHRLLIVFFASLYVGVFDWVYLTYLNPVHGYIGFDLSDPGPVVLGITHLLAIMPSFGMPLKVRRPSQVIYWILYLLGYIPSVLAPAYIQRRGLDEIVALSVFLFIGFLTIGGSYRLALLRTKPSPIKPSLFWNSFLALYIILLACVLYVFWGNLRLVAFNQIYQSIRFDSGEVASGTNVNYAVMLLGNVMNPFLMAYGLTQRRSRPMFLLGALGQVLLYASGGLKSYILSVVFLLIFDRLLKLKGFKFGYIFPAALTVCFAAFNALGLALGVGVSSLLDMANDILLMRILGVSGINTAVYQDFFANNPHTHYSHIKGISWVSKYPYEYGIGQEVGYFMSGNDDMLLNANANFWCTDGIAAWGLPGIIMVSIICGLILWVLDSVSLPRHRKLAQLLCIAPAILITNTSLFTTLLSGGLIFIIILIRFCPAIDNNCLKRTASQ